MKPTYASAIIVDDEEVIREGLSEYIGWSGLGIELKGAFADGREVLRYLEAHPVDIIVSDIRMPALNGLELIAAVREGKTAGGKQPQVIFLSGFDDFKYAQEAIRLGAFDYLLKPAEAEEIEKALSKAVRQILHKESPSDDKVRSVTEIKVPISHLIKKTMEIMSKRFSEDLQLSQIATELYVTPNYLSRLFRTETGKGFSDYLSDLRMEKAKSLLREGDRKIYQIGLEVGYPNPRYFSEWFHKNAGLTPKEYRNKFG